MKFSRFIVLGILVAGSSALRAQPTDASGFRAQAQNKPTAPSQELTGISIGGPVGVLTDQQRESYLALMKSEHGQLAELQSQLAAARHDVVVASVTGRFDETLVRQKALVAARLEAEMAVIRAKVFSQVQPPLTPEQIEAVIKNRPGPIHPLGRQQLERPVPHAPAATGTNQDANGLPPKK